MASSLDQSNLQAALAALGARIRTQTHIVLIALKPTEDELAFVRSQIPRLEKIDKSRAEDMEKAIEGYK